MTVTLVPGAVSPTRWRSTIIWRLLGSSPVGTSSGLSCESIYSLTLQSWTVKFNLDCCMSSIRDYNRAAVPDLLSRQTLPIHRLRQQSRLPCMAARIAQAERFLDVNNGFSHHWDAIWHESNWMSVITRLLSKTNKTAETISCRNVIWSNMNWTMTISHLYRP